MLERIAASARLLLLAALVGLAARGLSRQVRQLVAVGPLGTPLTGHPPLFSAAYYRWLGEDSLARLSRAVGASVPADEVVGHIGTIWEFGPIRYRLLPFRVEHLAAIDRGLDPSIALRRPFVVVSDRFGLMPELERHPHLQPLYREGDLTLYARRP